MSTSQDGNRLVSAIIPTRFRPGAVTRAIRSVLAQTYAEFEIIVVIDGPDEQTDAAALRALDPRVRVLALEANVGLAEARNVGIRAARGRWVALLDDDDEWLPGKLQAQVSAAEALEAEFVFVPCRFLEKTRTLERAMPVRLPAGAERFSEYMYCEGGYLQPSMYFMSRALALAVPFTKGLRHIEDSDWLLRAMQHPGVRVGAVPEVLSVYHNLKSGDRESETTPWRHPLEWATENHTLFTRRAFPFFVARLCLNAARAGEPVGTLLHLLGTARRYGRVGPRALGYFLAYWFLSDDVLKRVRVAARAAVRVVRHGTLPRTRRLEGMS